MSQPATIQTPNTRNTDPETSWLAAEKLSSSGKRRRHQEIIFDAVVANPGKTAGELGVITGLGQLPVTRRLSELSGVHITQGDSRICNINKTKMRTWYAK